MKFKLTLTTLAMASVLTACGGGGGGSSEPPVNATNFPIHTAMSAVYKNGLQKALTLTGTATNNGVTAAITGNMTILIGAYTGSTFEGAAANLSKSTVNGTLTLNGQSVPLTSLTLNYLSAANELVGMTYAGAYCVATTKGVFPATLTVGQAGSIGKFTCYTDANKTRLAGTRVMDYSTRQGDTTDKINFKVQENYYDSTGKFSASEGATYTITAAGAAAITQYFVTGSFNGTSFEVNGQ